jgi:hypothetical protein
MAPAPKPATAISTRLLLRIIILFIAAWSLLLGSVLVAFGDAGAGALGVGVTDPAGQRLAGALLLVLAPAYLLIAFRLDRYEAFVWLPIAAQIAVALTVGLSLLAGDTAFVDGILACALSGFFAALLGYVWIAEQRMVAKNKLEDASSLEVDAAHDRKL